MAAHGPQAIVPLNYAGPHGMLAGGSMDLRFFHRLGASLLDRKPLCGGVRTEAWVGTFGPAPGMPPEQAVHARLIVAWGNNVTWSNLHLTPIIRRARKAGAKLVVIDPRRTKIAAEADLHLAIRPGTDVVLAWAVAAELERRDALDRAFIERHVAGFEEYMAAARAFGVSEAARVCGVPEDDIRQLVDWYQHISPAAISVGNGLERNQNGGSGIRAVFALPALAGKFGVAGGGLINGASFAFPKTPRRLQRPDLVPAGTRTLNIVDIGRHLMDPACAPPIKALFIYNHNPLIVHPDQNRLRRGLAREDLFVVGADVVMTDSLAYADVVLPGLQPLRARRPLRRVRSALAPARGARHSAARARPCPTRRSSGASPRASASRMPAFTASDAELMDEAIDGEDPRLGGISPSALPTDRATAMTVDGEQAVLFGNVWPRTPSGKVELASTYLAEKYGARLPTWRPFALDLPARPGVPRLRQAHHLDLRGRCAAARRRRRSRCTRTTPAPAASGTACASGSGTTSARSTCRSGSPTSVPPGVVATLKGTWMRTSDNGQTVSALCPTHHADLSEGACFNDARVEVAAL